ncbi:MAG TPA: hypothetical protein VMF03_21495 [Steroidobacteraceae bacterium]|nr:hypothetical protein [Steroidobacteraceae bacterium]
MRNSMRLLAMAMALGILATTAAADAPAGKSQPKPSPSPLRCCKSLSIDGEDDLAKLAAANPRHYAILRRIVDASSEICRATAPSAQFLTKFDAQQLACRKALWLTSYPPKRELFVRIEDTVYFVLVVVRDTGGHVQPAG